MLAVTGSLRIWKLIAHFPGLVRRQISRQLESAMSVGRRSDVDVVGRQTDFVFLPIALQLSQLIDLLAVGTQFVILDSAILNTLELPLTLQPIAGQLQFPTTPL